MRKFVSSLLLFSALGCTSDINVYRHKKDGANIEVSISKKTKFTKVRVRFSEGEIYGEDNDGNGRYEKILVYNNGILVNQYPSDPKNQLRDSRKLSPYLFMSSTTFVLNEGKKETLAANK